MIVRVSVVMSLIVNPSESVTNTSIRINFSEFKFKYEKVRISACVRVGGKYEHVCEYECW